MGYKKPLLLNILTSYLCQFEACAIIWRQAVDLLIVMKLETEYLIYKYMEQDLIAIQNFYEWLEISIYSCTVNYRLPISEYQLSHIGSRI